MVRCPHRTIIVFGQSEVASPPMITIVNLFVGCSEDTVTTNIIIK